jgi:LuxR family maltose regulon positive regulatory protein
MAALWTRELAQLSDAERPSVRWGTFERHDDSTAAVVPQLVALLTSIDGVHTIVQDVHEPAFTAAHQICSAIAHHARPIVLVLDDFHLLHDSAALAFVQALLEHCPPNLHLVLLSRTPLPLDISRLTLQAAVLSLFQRDLSFDAAEFVVFVQQSRIAKLDAAQISDIQRFAEGWPAILVLINHLLRHYEPESGNSFLLHDSSDDLATFVEHEVIAALPDALRTLLVDTSFLPLLFIGLCKLAAPATHADHAKILKDAVASTCGLIAPFGVACSHGLASYRVHPVLRRFLLAQLAQTRDAEVLHTMRTQAACWLDANNLVDATLDTACIAPSSEIIQHLTMHTSTDAEFAADLVAAAGPATLTKGDMATQSRRISTLPEAVLLARPRLLFDQVWHTFDFATVRNFTYADRISTSLRVAAVRQDPHLAAHRSEAGIFNALESITMIMLDRAQKAFAAVDASQFAYDSIPAGFACIARAFLRFSEPPTLEHRLSELKRAKEIFSRLQHSSGWMAAAYAESWIRRSCADVQGALKNFEYSYLALEKGGLAQSKHFLLALIFHSDLLLSLDRIIDARTLLQRALRLVEQKPDLAPFAYHAGLRLQMCALSAGAYIEIDEVSDAQDWIRCLNHTTPFISASTAAVRIQRDIRLGRPDRNLHTLASIDLIDSDTQLDMSLGHQIAALGHRVHTGNNHGQIAEALEKFRENCLHLGWTFFALQARVLQLVHSLRLDAVEWNQPMMDELLTQIEATGLQGLILNYPQLAPMLEKSRHPIAEGLLQKLHAAAATHPWRLSTHEMRILRLMGDNLSPDDIAVRLRISISTVRTHVRHIYEKMNVHTRAEALRAASIAGILDG